jgi:heme-degrading monooxygenase HmoA
MIVRIFRVEIDPSAREAFETGFQSISVNAVRRCRGLISCEIGTPTKWSPDRYVMITRWENTDALIAFAGSNWNIPVIPVGMEGFAISCSVEHFFLTER